MPLCDVMGAAVGLCCLFPPFQEACDSLLARVWWCRIMSSKRKRYRKSAKRVCAPATLAEDRRRESRAEINGLSGSARVESRGGAPDQVGEQDRQDPVADRGGAT